MEYQQAETERFPQMVFPADMRSLVSKHEFGIPVAEAERKIYLRSEYAEKERGRDVLALINVIPSKNGGADPTLHPQITDHGIEGERRHSGDPYPREYGDDSSERTYAGLFGGSEGLGYYGIHGFVDHRKARVYRGSRVRHDGGTDRLGARNEAEYALYRERADETQSDDLPERHGDPFRRFFQNEAQEQYREDDISRRNAHIDDA